MPPSIISIFLRSFRMNTVDFSAPDSCKCWARSLLQHHKKVHIFWPKSCFYHVLQRRNPRFCRSLLQELRWQSKAILMSIAISSSGMKVRVRNISDLATEREVREFFSFSGQIKHVESDCERLLISFSICSASCFLCFSCVFPFSICILNCIVILASGWWL